MFNSRRLQRYLPAGLLVIALSVLYIFVAVPYQQLFWDNQHAYYLHGLLLSGNHPFLESDWIATSTRDVHPIFTQYVRFIASLNIIEIGTLLMQAILFVSMCMGFWLISFGAASQFLKISDNNADFSHDISPAIVAHIITLTAAILTLPPNVIPTSLPNYGFGHIIINLLNFRGLATQELYNNYLQPSEFGVLAFLGIGLMVNKRWFWSVLLLAITTNFHVGFLLHGTILTLVVAVWLLIKHNDWRTSIAITALYGILTLPIFIYGPFSFTLLEGTDQVVEYLTFERIPYHNWPMQFMNATNYVRLSVMLIASVITLISFDNVWRWVLPIGTAYIVIALVLTSWLESASLGMMQLWRGSVLYIPMSLVIILTLILIFINKHGNQIFSRYRNLMVMIWLTIIVMLGIGKMWYRATLDDNTPEKFINLYQEIESQTPPDTMLISPTYLYFLRLNAQRPLFVDWKISPYFPEGFAEWLRRVEIVEIFYEMPHDERVVICDQEGIDYYVLPIFAEDNEPDDWSTSLSVLDAIAYELVPCTDSSD